jgi:hypothetical protein
MAANLAKKVNLALAASPATKANPACPVAAVIQVFAVESAASPAAWAFQEQAANRAF